jgi:transposase
MKPFVTDELWAAIAPLLPKRRVGKKGGRPWVDDRAALNGILRVLRGGIAWRLLPTELGYGSGVTCWRRLREWQRRGVWKRLHQVMLARLAAVGPDPTGKGRPGSKHQLHRWVVERTLA